MNPHASQITVEPSICRFDLTWHSLPTPRDPHITRDRPRGLVVIGGSLTHKPPTPHPTPATPVVRASAQGAGGRG